VLDTAATAVLAELAVDGLHVVCGSPMSCLALREEALRTRLPLVVTEQQIKDDLTVAAVAHARIRRTYEGARVVIFVSEGNRRTATARIGLDGVRTVVIPNGVDVAGIQARVRDCGGPRRPTAPARVMTAARFAREKCRDVRGTRVIMFTVNGTRYLDRVRPGVTVLCAATVDLACTAAWIRHHQSGARVQLVATDPHTPEDDACAHHLRNLLLDRPADAQRTSVLVRESLHAHLRIWGAHVDADYLRSFAVDVARCSEVDTVPVVLLGRREPRGRTLLSAPDIG